MEAAEHAQVEALQTQKLNLQREREYAVANAHSREQVQAARKMAEQRAR